MKKQNLYLSSIAPDAPEVAAEYGLGLELAQFCTAAFLDNPDKVTELFPQDCARYLESSLAACLSSSDRFVLHGPFNELCPAAIDPLVLEITEKRYRQAIDRGSFTWLPEAGTARGLCAAGVSPGVVRLAVRASLEAADPGCAGNILRCASRTSWSPTLRCFWTLSGR